MEKIARLIRGKRGSQMAEAAIAVPVIILAAMLLIRMFVFCLEVLTAGIEEHRKALEEQDSYSGMAIRAYVTEREVSLLRGGLLMMDTGKTLEVKAYLINEDLLARSSKIFD